MPVNLSMSGGSQAVPDLKVRKQFCFYNTSISFIINTHIYIITLLIVSLLQLSMVREMLCWKHNMPTDLITYTTFLF